MGYFEERQRVVFRITNFPVWEDGEADEKGKFVCKDKFLEGELPFPEVTSSLKGRRDFARNESVKSGLYLFLGTKKFRIPKGFSGNEKEELDRKFRQAVMGKISFDEIKRTVEARHNKKMKIKKQIYVRLSATYSRDPLTGYFGWQWRTCYDYNMDKNVVGIEAFDKNSPDKKREFCSPDEASIVKGVDVTGIKQEGVWCDEKWIQTGFHDDDPKNPTIHITMVNQRAKEIAEDLLVKMKRFDNLTMLVPKSMEIDYEQDAEELKAAARKARQEEEEKFDLFAI